MKKILFVVFFLTTILFSCTQGYGTAYNRKKLTIYYTNNKDLDAVKKLADFWFSKELISNKPQSIRFLNIDSVSQVQLIQSPNFTTKTLNFESIKNLQELEDNLNETVFFKNNVDVVICDSRFNVINNLNY